MNRNLVRAEKFWSRPRILAVMTAAAVLTVFAGANAHLIIVAFATQPDCVPHLKAPEEGAATFHAAKSAC